MFAVCLFNLQQINCFAHKGPGKRGHIVAHDVSWAAQTGKHLLRTQNVSEQMRNIFCVPTNVVHVGKQGNICVGNNVSSFARALLDYSIWHFCFRMYYFGVLVVK